MLTQIFDILRINGIAFIRIPADNLKRDKADDLIKSDSYGSRP